MRRRTLLSSCPDTMRIALSSFRTCLGTTLSSNHFAECFRSSRVQWEFIGRHKRSAVGTSWLASLVKKFEERLDDIDRHRKDDRGILLGADLSQRLQITQLHGGWNAPEDLCGVDKGLRRLELGFRVDDLRTPVAFRLRLFRNGAHHVLRKLHGSDLDVAHLDPPGFGLGV